MFFFRPRISGNVGSVWYCGPGSVCACRMRAGTCPRPLLETSLGGIACYGWGEHPCGKSWERSSLLADSGDAGEGQKSWREQVPRRCSS